MSEEVKVVQNKNQLVISKDDYLGMPVGEPKNMLEVRAFANFLAGSKFLPQNLRGDANTAIMLIVTCKQYGLPITALSEVMEVNGKIGFWGRTKLAILLKSPLCEYLLPVEKTDKVCTIKTKRRGYPEEVKETYTIEMAEKAGLLSRSDAWKKHPADMLWWKCVNRVISTIYPDVIQGFATIEEEQERMAEQQAQVIDTPRAVANARRIQPIQPQPEEIVEAETPIVVEQVKPVEGPVEVRADSKTYEVIVKQVTMMGGKRIIVCEEDCAMTEGGPAEFKFEISTASLASELKKNTGTKLALKVIDGVVDSFLYAN